MKRPNLRHRALAGLTAVLLTAMASAPASALFLTTYGDFARMSQAEQAQIVESAIYEMIQYLHNTKREDSNSICVARYFSGSYGSDEGGYGDLNDVLDDMRERYDAGTLGDGEDSHVERAVLKLIKDKCGV
ncbi:MAG: hypothetical protein AAF563_09185 [Pseudomonadota bacterium]